MTTQGGNGGGHDQSMSATTRRLNLDQARRIALAAQGFAEPRPTGAVDRRHGRRMFDRTGVVQIDSVNVLCRTQELVLFARLGQHRRDLLPSMTDAGDVFEYWAHEASHVPVALHPFLRWRMDDAAEGRGTWKRVAQIRNDEPALVAQVLDQVRDRTCTIGMIEEGVHGQRQQRLGGMWGWNTTKLAAEYLFWGGRVTARRGPNFERWYDLPERALAPDVLALPAPSPAEAKKELLMVGARSHGVGTAADLVDYFRLNGPECRPLLAELVDEGRLLAAAVDGWDRPAYLHPDARRPHRVTGRALLSPFDPVVWNRDRAERLWGFRYRIEIYVPKEKRVHGYYVLPFLLDGDLVARVDLKADRQVGLLRVQAVHGEDGIDVDRVCGELAAELRELARFLGLEDGVVVEPKGDLASVLIATIGRA